MSTLCRLLVASCLLVPCSSSALDAPLAAELSREDQLELAALEREAPLAARLFERAEHARSAAQYGAAERLYAEARVLGSEVALLARRHCETLTQLGRRREALEACDAALHHWGSALDMRATVAALTSGDQPLSPRELSFALLLANEAVQSAPDAPWGYAAYCDIARRSHDDAMEHSCLARLTSLAPGHPETLAAMAREPWQHRIKRSLVPALASSLVLLVFALFIDRARRRDTAPERTRLGASARA